METYTHKQLAVNCFNNVWDLLDLTERTDAQNEEMVQMCHSSFWHWTQVEDHTDQNLSIGYWQLSRVYAVVGNGPQAEHYAQRCIDVSRKAELPPFFIAYGYEAMARAQMLLNNTEKKEKNLVMAKEFTDLIKVEDSKKLLLQDIEEIEKKGERVN
ncbi:hypothetical protein E3U55_06650 [Filobacillus milosensis]|uniref:Uncharacterized protein n=1 Tax=Filobacillus milosensis TaxID=94137 RepID=A0A4Y8IR21_9BACI|nr:hypothetical protein [Filobacillus milosensis]TFB22914.1 hypothetical protein E3U55_06650 [Filobacillus milosensis]